MVEECSNEAQHKHQGLLGVRLPVPSPSSHRPSSALCCSASPACLVFFKQHEEDPEALALASLPELSSLTYFCAHSCLLQVSILSSLSPWCSLNRQCQTVGSTPQVLFCLSLSFLHSSEHDLTQ